MPSIFTRIIHKELPARFVWEDEQCVAFLSANPLRPGHTLVVPRQEVDYWIDLEPKLADHLFKTAQLLARALQHGFKPVKVGLMIAGLEVRHVHIHLVPISTLTDLNFEKQDRNPNPVDMDGAAERIRSSIQAMQQP